MLRYPVYLHKLLKMAPADSDEQAMLLVAVHIVEELAVTINESKRRKELGISCFVSHKTTNTLCSGEISSHGRTWHVGEAR